MQSFKSIEITDDAVKSLQNFTLPKELAFGKIMLPVMIEANYQDGKWSPFRMVPYQKLELDPTAKVLHYAQEIFEGLKAYNLKGQGPFLFRPEENMERFNFSARRMAMAEVPEQEFLDAVDAITSYGAPFIPSRSGDSLYIRPFMFANENSLGIKPAENFKFLIVASPSEAYFKSGSVRVLVENDAVRACPGGVGNAKTGGNYAASLLSMIQAKQKGYDQVLWLDAVHKKYIEEMSGMNFFAVYDRKIVTPPITSTILNGITRKSLIKLAKHMGFEIEERPILVDELLADIKSEKCTECFSCGTAVIITPIDLLGIDSGEKFPIKFSQGPVANELRLALLNIQEGSGDDPFGWRKSVERAKY